MTAPGASSSGDTTSGSTTESPGYTSPTEQFQEAMARLGLNPAWGFRQLFEKLGSAGKSGGSGGRFEFSLSEVRELHRQFAAETDAFEKMVEKQNRASLSLIPLADDPASRKHHTAALEHSAKVSKAINEQYKFAKGFRDAIGAAIGIKAEGEDATSSAMRGIGGNVA